MKNYILFMNCAIVLFMSFSCTEEKNNKQVICTEIFVSVDVIFKDVNGNLIDIASYTSVNTRTNKTLMSGKKDGNSLGTYTVANDNYKKEFSKTGDIVLVTAKHPITQIVKKAEFKIAADECHIIKISGPAVIVFD